MHDIRIAVTTDDLAAIRELFLEYARALTVGTDETSAGVHMSLHQQGFERELETLPGRYAPPTGTLLLATLNATPVACGALREIPTLPTDRGRVCELKRMYVRPSSRGNGLGRAIATQLLDFARTAGYAIAKLDTEPTFVEAVTLYRSLGFTETDRYNDDPVPCTMFMAKEL
ncbi:MAG: GNAT family N-acetyltransferase [Phycisphaerales bacterium]